MEGIIAVRLGCQIRAEGAFDWVRPSAAVYSAPNVPNAPFGLPG